MQTDLFGTAGMSAQSQIKSPAQKTDFLERHKFVLRLDHALVGFIGLLIVYVLVFSFGVEKGKRYSTNELKTARIQHDREIGELKDKLYEQSQLLSGAPGLSVGNSTSAGQGSEIAHDSQIVTELGDVIAPVNPEKTEKKSGKPAGRFTIQVVTFNSKVQAEKEISRLSSLGQQPFSITSGKYHLLCLNGFATKDQASKALKALKAEGVVPKDAYVRPLPQQA